VSNIFARKSMAVLKAEAEETEVQSLVTHGGVPLKRTLSVWSLISLGIGCIIGAGIFVLTGHAAATNAGPAIALSFVLSGIACAFAGLCYAEMASTIPIASSAYAYAYACHLFFLWHAPQPRGQRAGNRVMRANWVFDPSVMLKRSPRAPGRE
jgi:basic amino acid/polyamine antiporter, APA family